MKLRDFLYETPADRNREAAAMGRARMTGNQASLAKLMKFVKGQMKNPAALKRIKEIMAHEAGRRGGALTSANTGKPWELSGGHKDTMAMEPMESLEFDLSVGTLIEAFKMPRVDGAIDVDPRALWKAWKNRNPAEEPSADQASADQAPTDQPAPELPPSKPGPKPKFRDWVAGLDDQGFKKLYAVVFKPPTPAGTIDWD